MTRYCILPTLLSALVLLPRSGSAQPPGNPLPPPLKSEERELAARLALADAKKKLGLAEDEKLVLVSVELLLPKTPAEARAALVSHYRYKDDTGILSTIDLTAKTVTRTRASAQVTLPLSIDERELATKLALEHKAVRALVGEKPVGLSVSALVVRPPRGDAAFGHRVAHLFLRVKMRVLKPIVEVDLTTKSVRVIATDDAPKRAHD